MDDHYLIQLCPFLHVMQYSLEGKPEDVNDVSLDTLPQENAFVLGKWDSWIASSEEIRPRQSYLNGTECWRGPSRSSRVTFECGDNDELVSFRENGKCTYELTFSTTAACTLTQADAVADEIAELDNQQLSFSIATDGSTLPA